MTGPGDLAQAQAHLAAGRLAEAEALCHAALARNIGDAGAWLLLSGVALRAGRVLDGEAAVRRSLALRPESLETPSTPTP